MGRHLGEEGVGPCQEGSKSHGGVAEEDEGSVSIGGAGFCLWKPSNQMREEGHRHGGQGLRPVHGEGQRNREIDEEKPLIPEEIEVVQPASHTQE